MQVADTDIHDIQFCSSKGCALLTPISMTMRLARTCIYMDICTRACFCILVIGVQLPHCHEPWQKIKVQEIWIEQFGGRGLRLWSQMQTLAQSAYVCGCFLPSWRRDLDSLPVLLTIQSTSDGPSGHLLDLIQMFACTRYVSSFFFET